MPRRYTVPINAVTLSAAVDLIEVVSAASKVTKILGYELGQPTLSQDANERIVRLERVEGIGSVTSGSGGSTPTPNKVEEGDAAFAGTTETGNTTRMVVGSGSLKTTYDSWNLRVPKTFWYTPETMPVLAPGNRWTLGVAAAVSGNPVVSGTVHIQEEG